MRNVTEDTLTAAVAASFATGENARFRFLTGKLVAHLHAYARETQLTPTEWKTAIDFLYAAGKISTDNRNEFILMSDVLGLSSMVDMLQSGKDSTAHSNRGPFHSDGSPALAVGGDLKRNNAGDTLRVSGFVRDTQGKPVDGATLDYWQAAANGFYWQQDATQDKNNLRCKMVTGADGRYEFTSVRPAPYTVPYDGPVGDLLRAGGRHAWRPAHLHFIVSAPGFHDLTTEVFFADDQYIDEDAVFGVRESLLVKLTPAQHNGAPCLAAAFDFKLHRT